MIPPVFQFFLNVGQRQKLLLYLLNSKPCRIIAVKFAERVAHLIPAIYILIIIQTAVIARHPEKLSHIHGAGTLFIGQQGLIHFLSVADPDGLHGAPMFCVKQLQHRLRLILYRTGRCLLYQYITVSSVLEGK